MDLLDVASVEGAVSEALGTWKRIDVLVNNAAYEGVGLMDKILELRFEDLETVLTGVRNQFRLVQCVLPQMLLRDNGAVVTTGSVAATLDPPGPAGEGGWGVAHAMSKAAVQRITPALHVEFRPRGIRSFTVDPGFVITEQMRATGVNERFEEAGALTNPAEVPGAVIAWLATSPEADQLSGQLVSALEICHRHQLLPGWSAPPATWPALQEHGQP
jgi:NAD(P)-dependent dehydrogenase (short-subunit alcohol dehydrogenase family)